MADISGFRSFNHEMGVEDLLFCQQWSVDSIFDELSIMSNMDSIFCEDFNPSYNYAINNMNSRQPDLKRAPEYSSQDGGNIVIRPLKQLKSENKPNSLPPPNHTTFYTQSISHVGTTTLNKKPKEQTIWYSSTTNTITFGQQNYNVPKSCEDANNIISTNSITTARAPSAQERMLAERKRREKLTQRFIALSALVPGLKKMDKASVLADAIKHLKQLQDKVKILEDNKQAKKRNAVSVIKKYKPADHIDSISTGSIITDESLRIETRLCDKDVLIHIQCEKKKGVMEKTIAEIEKLNLSVVNSSIITFGNSVLNISLVAQMDEEFTLEMNKALVNNLNVALSKYSCEK